MNATMGMNRTGLALSPIDKQDMLEVTALTRPSTDADGEDVIAAARGEFIREGVTVGSIPPPATLKGAVKTTVDMAKGVDASALVDKLAERLAFERTGTRLYGALVDKCAASPPLPGGPTVEDLAEIEGEELAHFELVRDAIISLGADPTAMTPAADVTGVASMGLMQVATDPRITLAQSLEAILIAELTDNDGWATLVELVRAAGHDEIADRFTLAREREAEHLAKVRSWVSAACLGASPAAAE